MEILGLASISKDSEFSQEIYKGVDFISHTIAIYKDGKMSFHTVHPIFSQVCN